MGNPRGTKTPSLEDGVPAPSSLVWEKEVVAKDELSTTYRQTAKIETDEQAEEAALRTQTDTFWPQIEAIVRECDEVLSELGWPGAHERVLHQGDGKWSSLPSLEELKKNGGQIVDGYWLTQRYTDDYSDPWYAGQIGSLCHKAIDLMRVHEPATPHIFSYIYQIASLRTDWKWRLGHKPSILTGKKQRKYLKDIRDSNNKSAKAKVSQRREYIRQLLPNTSRTGGALDRWLVHELKSKFMVEVSGRTVRSDRAALKALR